MAPPFKHPVIPGESKQARRTRLQREYYQRNRPHYLAHRRDQSFKVYGLNESDYVARINAQDGKCAICGNVLPVISGKGRPPIDHDHETGRVRGILCHSCNVGLGHFNDSVEVLTKAIEYLRNSNASSH